jgi:hypothetical protein
MAPRIDRRHFICCMAAFIPSSVPQPAPRKPALDGAWRSAASGDTAEVTVAGYVAVGFFWGYHYIDPGRARFSNKGERLDFSFNGGRATLTRTGARTALLVVEQGPLPNRIEMVKD